MPDKLSNRKLTKFLRAKRGSFWLGSMTVALVCTILLVSVLDSSRTRFDFGTMRGNLSLA